MNDLARERDCPFCGETIKASAVICHFCHSGSTPAAPGHGGACPFCAEAINAAAVKCRHCHADVLNLAPSATPGRRLAASPGSMDCEMHCFFKYFGDDARIQACIFGCQHHVAPEEMITASH